MDRDRNKASWYLGIDLGTTTISAALLNRVTGEIYQIYWWNDLDKVNPEFSSRISGESMFRLPMATYSGFGVSKLFVEAPATSVVVGALASLLAKQPGIYLQNFKPYLKIGIPYYSQENHEWEPTLQLPGEQSVSLYWVRWALQAILSTLTPQSTRADAPVKVGAIGLESETLAAALAKLEGVVLSYPKSWGNTYQINLREAVIEANLVQEIGQIFFLEDAIATILSILSHHHTVERSKTLVSPRESSQPQTQNSSDISSIQNLKIQPQNFAPWCGLTLAINCGATATEMALVDVPNNWEYLTYKSFKLRSWGDGGNGIERDIFWQLLYPQMSEKQLEALALTPDLEMPLSHQAEAKKSDGNFHPIRDMAASKLSTSALGQALLKACGYLKLILQRKAEFTLELGNDSWLVKRQDFESKVMMPFVEQINREVNALLVEGKVLGTEIIKVICIGGTSNFPAIQKWLQQKFPNATLIQEDDLALGIAGGLARLPLYPQVLNSEEQQYSDYFILLEILKAFSLTKGEDSLRAYRIKEIMRLLERRGLNTAACCDRIIPLIEGKLPSGFVPSIDYPHYLSEASRQNLYYTKIAAAGLFSVCEVSDLSETSVTIDGEKCYRPNLKQHQDLLEYLDLLLSNTHHAFDEPLLYHFGGDRG
ncbi:MAG TPA: hypothetical protein DEG17_06650 [Cyanobacteria bacterium UBA11149]|nr:hypothetical protein [Cyanobacteria bacterium UBA11367]HBE59198.1 hypothetical protein [Cyanobacteria bacterium UBA11366]HBK64479.1 hypothetical protein [Cyanobacteria bacterium UBA11166]HBR73563.1 hypothetical protein [Cyanobacteria bacterium UBA11159]HBS69344.1 hypothetical protein [Cyanobacteria bacterium UBA11153]HBW88554.1 hypothetical protein [Cyanobacteria bacterium UBA11149]HCA98265.1 hypothetical protein [Cyanobacteria bacterium UBA9226]